MNKYRIKRKKIFYDVVYINDITTSKEITEKQNVIINDIEHHYFVIYCFGVWVKDKRFRFINVPTSQVQLINNYFTKLGIENINIEKIDKENTKYNRNVKYYNIEIILKDF